MKRLNSNCVIKALLDKGFAVGKDVMVVGYDNLIPEIEYRGQHVSLTSVDQNLPRFVSTVVQKLLALIRDEEAESETLPVRLVLRESTGNFR